VRKEARVRGVIRVRSGVRSHVASKSHSVEKLFDEGRETRNSREHGPRSRSWTRVMDEAFRDALQAFASPRDVSGISRTCDRLYVKLS
jgi:hypothetical protein